MERVRLLFAVLAGTFIYVLMAMTGGHDGIWASNQMREQKQLLYMHTVAIEKTNEELTQEKVALQKDLDVISAYAKKLGFVGEGEKLVKIVGLPARDTHIFDPGIVLRHKEVKFIPESVCKACGVIVMLLSYFVSILLDVQRGFFRRNATRKALKTEGIKVYEIA